MPLQLVESDLFYEGDPSFHLRFDEFEISAVVEAPILKVFNVKTFHTFLKNRSTEVVTEPVDKFMAYLSLEDRQEVATTLVMCNMLLKQQANTSAEVYDIVDECRNLLNQLDLAIDLCGKIHDWVQACIADGSLPMADMSEAGTRPQDRADMTFVREEAEIITEITILYKLLVPITGEFIYRHTATINGQFKETLVASMTTDILKRNYLKIIQKLTHYIHKLVSNKVHSQQDVALHYRGWTVNHITRSVMDLVLVKKSASFELYKADGSVIKYIASCVKSFIESQLKNGSTNFNIRYYNDPKEGDLLSGSEETNSSRVEVESASSRKPAIVYPIANMTANWIVDQYITHEKVSKQRFYEALDYYNEYPVLITPISQTIVGNYFGPQLCGAKSIYLIEGEPMVRLVTLLQCLLVDAKAKQLPHALTMTVAMHERVGGLNDFATTNAWKASAEYAELRKTVTSGYGEVSWDAVLRNIDQMLSEKPMLYHTAPSIWEGIREVNGLTREECPDKTGKIFDDNLALMLETTSLFTELWKSRKFEPDNE